MISPNHHKNKSYKCLSDNVCYITILFTHHSTTCIICNNSLKVVLLVVNVSFINISAISQLWVYLMEETGAHRAKGMYCKKSVTIPNCQSETADNTMTKRTNSNLQNITQNIKDRATRTPRNRGVK